jgi:predicted dehydrogenase
MRIGLLGLGFMGRVHAAAIRSVPGASLAAVFTREPSRIGSGVAGNLGDAPAPLDLGDAKICPRAEDILDDPDIDAVDICLPTYLHAEIAILAFQRGKHVLVEKPMSIDPLSAAEIIDAATGADRVLMVAHVLRFAPAYQALRERVRNGSLGPLRSLFLRRICAAPTWGGGWFEDSSKSGGAMLDLLIHDADIALSLLGPPHAVAAVGYRDLRRGIDVVSAHLEYAKGPAVTIAGGWHHPQSYPFSMGYTAVFDGGTLEYGSQSGDVVLHAEDGNAQTLSLPAGDAYAAEIAYFLECCREGRAPDLCPPQDSANAVDLCLRLGEARLVHGNPVRGH